MTEGTRQPPQALLSVLDRIVDGARSHIHGRPSVIGLAGPQGSGKTTLARAWSGMHPAIAHFSLDDVYLDQEQRRQLAATVHPLLATRGPPGMHDLALLIETLDRLSEAGEADRTPIPCFDKVADARIPAAEWPAFAGRPSAILLDGWCLGALPEADVALADPINDLEAQEDPKGVWREYVNERLKRDYPAIWDRLDAILYLQAPSWDVVARWRGQQEADLLGRPLSIADDARIARFVQHFERVTRAMQAGARRPGTVVRLGAERQLLSVDAAAR
ncbi:MAG: hypothetical protein R3C52_04540 [Hyphomonadaceae bacterium]